MSVNLDNATILMSAAYIKNASAAFGPQGGDALRLLLDSVRLVLAARPPELINPPLTVVAPVGNQDADAIAAGHGKVAVLVDAEAVADYVAQRSSHECLIVIAADRTFRVVMPTAIVDHVAMATSAVVYHRRNGIERIAAGTTDVSVLKLSPISASAFADPTFSSLDDALDHYGRRARETACEILRPVWAGGADGPRLVLNNRPEHTMRESLFQALSFILRKADVTREHVVDATKPVDIRVAWNGSPAEALIEIKWLGRSLTAPGSATLYTNYSAGRAQEGANQLANYLDLKKSNSAKQSVLGYLVVFDARRRKVNGPHDRLSGADALAFEHDDIVYGPDHAALRADFKPPRRWFMRPRESDFQEAA
jgi:hypothetical protein